MSMFRAIIRNLYPPGNYVLRCAGSHNNEYLVEDDMTGLLRLSADGKKACFRLSYVHEFDSVFSLFSIVTEKFVGWKDGVGIGAFAGSFGAKNALFVMDNYDSVAQGIVLRLVNYREGAPFLTLSTDETNALCIDNEKGLAFMFELDEPFANIEWIK